MRFFGQDRMAFDLRSNPYFFVECIKRLLTRHLLSEHDCFAVAFLLFSQKLVSVLIGTPHRSEKHSYFVLFDNDLCGLQN